MLFSNYLKLVTWNQWDFFPSNSCLTHFINVRRLEWGGPTWEGEHKPQVCSPHVWRSCLSSWYVHHVRMPDFSGGVSFHRGTYVVSMVWQHPSTNQQESRSMACCHNPMCSPLLWFSSHLSTLIIVKRAYMDFRQLCRKRSWNYILKNL